MDKSVQRNPFWSVITEKTPLYGFKYTVVKGNDTHKVIIHGLINGREATLEFPFPRVCRAMSSVPNFKSKYINFLRRYTKEIGFISPDPRFQEKPERKSTFIDKMPVREKKPLAIPTPIHAAIQKEALPVLVAPYIPSTYVGDKPKREPNEPVSDTMVLAMFLVPASDLSTVIEVTEGVAKFRGSKPAPLRILGGLQPVTPPPVTPPPPPPPPEDEEPPVTPPVKHQVNVVHIFERRQRHEGVSAMTAIAERIHSDPDKVWTSTDFLDLMPKKNSVQTTLSLLATAKRIRRTGIGRYMAPMPKKKVARK